MNRRVALIDSGIGGLTLLRRFIRYIPSLTYIADNKFFPYGTKKDSDLIDIIDRVIYYLLNNEYEKVILACNTASYIYMRYLSYKYRDSVISIIDNTISDLEKIQKLNHVGVVATNQVVEGNIYADLISERFNIKTTQISASDLANLCENYHEEAIKAYLDKHFNCFKENDIDALILGCTHFNLIEKEIKNYFNNAIPIICSGYSILDRVRLNDLCLQCSENIIYLTDYDEAYVNKINNLFEDLKNIKIMSLNI